MLAAAARDKEAFFGNVKTIALTFLLAHRSFDSPAGREITALFIAPDVSCERQIRLCMLA